MNQFETIKMSRETIQVGLVYTSMILGLLTVLQAALVIFG